MSIVGDCAERRSVVRNLFFFAVMSLIWGLTWAAIKLGLNDAPPRLLAAARYLLTALAAGAWLFGEAVGWAEITGAILLLAAAAIALLRPLDENRG
ncbi:MULTISPECIES: hypothetical protein [Mesorhizobium]|uniref:hypothetical protein n=2 Tax=Phyllobacteriaceae TaxID=69277 RepID=UPI0013DF2D73|nr:MULTISPECIES: hypothetical protein [Mesorhizobium]